MPHETCIALYLYTIVRSVLQNPILHYIRWKHLIILHYTEMICQIADIAFLKNHYKNTTTATLIGYLNE